MVLRKNGRVVLNFFEACDTLILNRSLMAILRAKRDQNDENTTVFGWYFFNILRFGGTPRKFSSLHLCVVTHRLRNTGIEKRKILSNGKKKFCSDGFKFYYKTNAYICVRYVSIGSNYSVTLFVLAI